VCFSDQIDDTCEGIRIEWDTASFGDDPVDDGSTEVRERRQGALAQRVPVLTAAALREMDVTPSLRDVP
jgi:hypothetical protein